MQHKRKNRDGHSAQPSSQQQQQQQSQQQHQPGQPPVPIDQPPVLMQQVGPAMMYGAPPPPPPLPSLLHPAFAYHPPGTLYAMADPGFMRVQGMHPRHMMPMTQLGPPPMSLPQMGPLAPPPPHYTWLPDAHMDAQLPPLKRVQML